MAPSSEYHYKVPLPAVAPSENEWDHCKDDYTATAIVIRELQNASNAVARHLMQEHKTILRLIDHYGLWNLQLLIEGGFDESMIAAYLVLEQTNKKTCDVCAEDSVPGFSECVAFDTGPGLGACTGCVLTGIGTECSLFQERKAAEAARDKINQTIDSVLEVATTEDLKKRLQMMAEQLVKIAEQLEKHSGEPGPNCEPGLG
ncbi:hypothetical protein GGR56DRAFT_617511 [Xylariaceae sp. FL0804]|nr:hypothetical protein GGR56DRAFT_617511 [Xylariaceae sp. FL0804]